MNNNHYLHYTVLCFELRCILCYNITEVIDMNKNKRNERKDKPFIKTDEELNLVEVSFKDRKSSDND